MDFPSNRSHKTKKSREFDLSKRWIASEVTCIGSYTLGKTLGEGTFGKVKVGTHILTGQEVAIKIVDKIHAPLVAREIETWRHLHHPNIAQLYEVIVSDDKIYMATELCRGGEIFDYVCEHGRLRDDSPETKRIFRQIVEAVGYCHEKNFVHRDLKLENILLTSDLQVKVIDFGFTKQYSDRKLLDTYCGSVAYAAPEMISGKKYSGPQADVWSLGVILYTLVCGYLPFDDNNDLMVHKKIVELDYELPEWLSEESTDLIKKILQLDGLSRLSIIDILKHPWLSSEAPGAGTDVAPIAAMDALALAATPISASLATSPPESSSFFASSTRNMADEEHVLSLMNELGLDTAHIRSSVESNLCDPASALWYLLLEKRKATALSSVNPTDTVAGTIDAKPHPASAGIHRESPANAAAPQSPLTPSNGIVQPTSGSNRPLSAGSIRSAGLSRGAAAALGTSPPSGSSHMSNGGRRKTMIEAMQSASPAPDKSRKTGRRAPTYGELAQRKIAPSSLPNGTEFDMGPPSHPPTPTYRLGTGIVEESEPEEDPNSKYTPRKTPQGSPPTSVSGSPPLEASTRRLQSRVSRASFISDKSTQGSNSAPSSPAPLAGTRIAALTPTIDVKFGVSTPMLSAAASSSEVDAT